MQEKFIQTQLRELPPRDLLKEAFDLGEQVTRSEEIPISRITTEVLIVDDNHAEELKQSIASKWGQISEIVVRARIGGQTAGDISYDIIDGFHRYEAIKLLEKSTIKATVLYGCTDEEMYDLRILAANSVKAVKFPRLGHWMKGAWHQTPWKDKIALTQAFSLAMQDSSGKKLGLAPKEAESVKEWCENKAKQWLIPVGTIYSILHIIEAAAPDLVIRVRSGGKFEKGGLSLTPQQLSVIARAVPGQYELQRRIAKYAVGMGVSTKELSVMVEEVANLKDLSDEELVGAVIRHGSWRGIDRLYNPGEKRMTTRQILGPLSALKGYVHNQAGFDKRTEENILKEIKTLRERIRQELEGNTT